MTAAGLGTFCSAAAICVALSEDHVVMNSETHRDEAAAIVLDDLCYFGQGPPVG